MYSEVVPEEEIQKPSEEEQDCENMNARSASEPTQSILAPESTSDSGSLDDQDSEPENLQEVLNGEEAGLKLETKEAAPVIKQNEHLVTNQLVKC